MSARRRRSSPACTLWKYSFRLFRSLRKGGKVRAGGDGVADDGALFRRAGRITGLDERLVDALARSCVSDETARDARFDERYEEAAHRMIAGIGGRIPRITKGRVPRRTSA